MSRWSAASDLDYRNECEGPYYKTVDRTCACCGETFAMVVEGEYLPRPWCPACISRAAAAARQQDERGAA